MAEPKTSRPFQQRFLDGYDRSQLRQEVQKVKPSRFSGLKKKYATWALGASLAFGGIGVPMKMMHDAQSTTSEAQDQRDGAAATSATPAIAGDLATAKNIAAQVAGGVQAVATGVQGVARSPLATVAQAPQQIAKAVAGAPQAVAQTAEKVKEHFFKTEVPFGTLIYDEAKKNDLPPELVAAVVHTESKFVPTARSAAGAVGLMQLVPKTGRWMGARDLTNPAQNIAAGTKYLRYLSDRFNGDEQKTIAAFNAGEGNVRRFGGVPPFRETRNYLSRVNSFKSDITDQVSNHTLVAQAQ
ncbi:MAG: Lytic transglycosylase catalytic [Acidobacteria bacterium]|nr:Lytic transglycosylase catalytic [Acidobacteriota bacterium]